MKNFITAGDVVGRRYKFNGANKMLKPDFNIKVWAALNLIPRGKITTYKAIAEYLGQPRAARAVGRACNKNPGAPKIPCHRVIKSDGSLGGYRGGVKRKIELLKAEGVKVIDNKVENIKKKMYKFR